MIAYLKEKLSEDRFNHSISVSKTAVKLAEMYGADVSKAKLAGLIHDCGKHLKGDNILNFIRNHGYEVDEISEKSPGLLHGLAGAILANELMGVCDEEVLNSITYHTTGRKKMSKLEKIIYLSDYIEPLRNFSGVDELRNITYEDLDKGLLKALDNTIVFVISKGQLIQKDTIDARNYLLIKVAGEDR